MWSLQRTCILALCMSHVTFAARVYMRKRDAAPATPSTIPVQLAFDNLGRYTIPVGMDFNFTLTTSSGLTAVAGDGCSSCSSTNLYNMTKSTTAQSLDGSDGASLADASYSGRVIKEACSMTTANGSEWDYKNQTIVVADSQGAGSIFSSGVSGVLGLGTNRNAAPASISAGFTAGFNDTIYGQWLNNHPAASSFRYGMSISPPIVTPKNTSSNDQPMVTPKNDAGTLHWLAPDSSAYNPNTMASVNAQNNTAVNYSTPNGQPDFTIELDSWKLTSGGSSAQNNLPMVSTVDPYYTDIYFPLAEAQLLNDIIPGSSYQPSLSSLGSQSGAWLVPCDSKFSFTVSIGSQSFTLDQSALMTNSGGVCTSGIEGWTNGSITQYVLGARFLSQFYVIFEVNRNGTDTVILAARSSTSHSTDVGTIVGGTIGGVAGVLLIAFAGLFYYRRRHRNDNSEKIDITYDPSGAVVEPYVIGGAPQAPQPQFVSPPGSPGVVSPLLSGHQDMDVSPPAYEAMENSSMLPMSTARVAKEGYIRPTSTTVSLSSGYGASPSFHVASVSGVQEE